MAYHMTREEVLCDVWQENDEEYSSFEVSESDKGEEDNNNVYGYPNDRSGRVFGELSSDVEIDAIRRNVNNNQDLNNGDHMQNNAAPNIVFVDEQDISNVRQAIIVDDEDHESEAESDASIEVQPRASKRPRRAVTQNTQQPGSQPAQFVWGQGAVDNEIPAFQVRPGPVRVWGGECTPLTLFQLFWDDKLFDFIKNMTNKNALVKRHSNPEKHKAKWSEIENINEMKTFFGICVAMGILKLPEIHLYWQRKYSLFEIADWNQHMNRDRFMAILRYLKFCNEEVESQPQQVVPGQPPAQPDKLYKVRRFLDQLLPRYAAEWTGNQWLAIDEQMIPYRGRVGFRQFVANKPKRFGIKVWAMADATNGYVLQQQIYTGKNVEQRMPEVGLGTRVVLDLTKGYENQGYIVVTDNFYTSPTLAQKLLQKGINSLGTVKGNTRGLPKELVFPQKPKPVRGSSSWRTCGRLLAVSWYDNKPVYFLSTIHKPLHAPDTPQANKEVKRRSKQGVIQVPCPTVLKDYNKYMCGIDRADQNNRYYSAGRNCKRWPPRIVFHQLETSINNAFQLYKAIPTSTQKLTSREFRMTLATNLMMSYRTSQAIGRPRKDPITAPRLQNVGDHMSVVGPPRVCAVCSHVYSPLHRRAQEENEEQGKRPQPARSIISCELCEVNLCLNSNSNCWVTWHAKTHFL